MVRQLNYCEKKLELFFVAFYFHSWTFPNLSLSSWKVVGLRLREVFELGVRSPNVSVLLVSFVPFFRTR